MNKDTFISYKNDSKGNDFAARLCADLEKMDYNIYYNSTRKISFLSARAF